MYFPHRAEDELTHITGMVNQLELLAVRRKVPQTNLVLRPDHWRARINTLLTRPNLPRAITSQTSDLMTTLDVASAASDRCPAHVCLNRQTCGPVRSLQSAKRVRWL
jgi:hypothetical protein